LSLYGDILDRLLAMVGSGYTTHRGFVPLSEITNFPFMYAYMGNHAAERLRFGMERREYTAVIAIVVRGETQEQFYARIDQVLADIEQAPTRTLPGAEARAPVDTFFVSNVAPFEFQKPADTKAAQLTITLARDV